MKHLVQQAIQHEYISPRMNADSLSITLSMQFYSWIQLWANDQITLKELETRGHYTFAVTLAGAATEAAREALLDQIIQLQESLPGKSRRFSQFQTTRTHGVINMKTVRKSIFPEAEDTWASIAARELTDTSQEDAVAKIQSWNLHVFARRAPDDDAPRAGNPILPSDVIFLEAPLTA
jgi:hypothetical protein